MSDLPSDVLQELLTEINQRRGLSLTKADVTVTGPFPANSQGRNTELRIAAPAAGVSVTAYYHRLQLSVLFSGMSAEFVDGNEATTLDLIPRIATRRGLTLDPDDFISTPIDRTGGYPVQVVLQAKSDSLTYTGIAYTLTLVEESVEPEIPADAILTMEGEPITTMEGDFILIIEE